MAEIIETESETIDHAIEIAQHTTVGNFFFFLIIHYITIAYSFLKSGSKENGAGI
jgi:hypothetical protein